MPKAAISKHGQNKNANNTTNEIEGAFLTCEFNGRMTANRSGFLMHEELRKTFDDSKARYKYIIADACHSGGVVREEKAKATATATVSYPLSNCMIL